MKILTIFDGTLHSKRIVNYAIDMIQESGGELVLLQVFDRSVFVDYDAGPRAVDLARAEMGRQLDWAKNHLEKTAPGMLVSIIVEEGDTIERALFHAETQRVDMLFSPPRFQALGKSAPCPVRIIPGTILVPVDSSGNHPAVAADRIVREATMTGSPVLLVGVVPVHVYSREEREELETVRKQTAAAVRRAKELLVNRGIEVRDVLRSGYPDEEILKAADEHAASLIMLPSGGMTPSELSKAAAILLEDAPRHHRIISLFPAEGAV